MGDGDLGAEGGVEFWRAEAARWWAEAARLAAEDVVQRARIADLEGQVDALTERVSVLARMAFGTSSEKKAKQARGEDGAAGAWVGMTRPAGRPVGRRRSVVVGRVRVRAGTAAGTTPVFRPVRRSTT